jgi:hypothetical protein
MKIIIAAGKPSAGNSVKKFSKGGKTNLQMKELGRGLAKVANQKISSFKYKNSGSK